MKKNLFLLITCCIIYTSIHAQTDWHITGNSGTNPGTNFVGTTDSQALAFRTKNIEQMRILASGNVGIGAVIPLQKLDVNGNINLRNGFGLFMGNHRVLKVDSAGGNTFLGNGVGARNISGKNTAVGYQALSLNTSGSYNTAMGYQSLYSNYAGYDNTATGVLSLYLNSTGHNNAAYGNYTMFLNTTGSYNTASGYNALSANSTGSNNAAYGMQAMYNNTDGSDNAVLGKYALYANKSGYYNTAIGSEALYANTAGYNTATGYRALYSNTTGYDNAAHGWGALYNNTTGLHNTAQGLASLYSNVNGNYNTAIGSYALYNTYYSSNNTALGDIAGASYYNGWNNTFLGAAADATGPDIYNSIAIGNVSRVSASNQVRIGNTSTTSIGGYAGWSTISDTRVKKNIKENVPGLAFINKLKPVTYNLDLDAADKFTSIPVLKQHSQSPQPAAASDAEARSKKQAIIYTGFLAQDVEKAAKSINYDFSGVDAAKNDKDLYSLRYAEFVVPLVKAVQELSDQNEDLKNQNDVMKSEIGNLKSEIEEMKKIIGYPASGISNNTQQTINDERGASLEQNIPNPFNKTTTINYTLPRQYSPAKLIITDKTGKILREINISGTGKGSLQTDASAFASGAYQYSLMVNGKLISTKQMVLVK